MKKLFAAIGFFTRIPVWRLTDIPADKYKRVVDLWPLAGWFTGGITALTLWGGLQILPTVVAVILAFAIRLILTGALHEDGLADFIDGMGGGTNRTRILEIMKDSAIGSYGVIGLIFYFLLLIGCVTSFPAYGAPLIILIADPWSKFCGSLLINFLPYSRKQEEAKNKLIYDRMSPMTFAICLLCGLLPCLIIIPILHLIPPVLMFALLPSLSLSILIILYLRYKIGGYTGDCCGATALLCELTFYLSALIVLNL
ncbi:MAG: adenosylcobinamide-GDP ribazoletransferase [Muribaculaceae bacterium]|nr:adenosylcobinamide-GDP ribazoletransferase [Muribaculaceae bacterium]